MSDGRPLAGAIVACLLAACTGSQGPSAPWPVTPFPDVLAPDDNAMSPERIELGRLLFHDPILSSDRTVACVTCHGEIWGFSDGLPQSIGVGGVGPAGTGRTGPAHTRRNSTTLWNAAFRLQLFWDGRAGSLERQVTFPLAEPIELGRAPAEVAADLRATDAYVAMFQAAFPAEDEPVNGENLARALAAFERTLVTRDAPYDRWIAGDEGALDDVQTRGMRLFGEAACDGCHVPPLFESDRFEAGATGDTDGGREDVTGDPADRGRFRVPTLRNVRITQPYFHDGSVGSLEDAIAIEVRLRARRALADDEVASILEFVRKALHDVSRMPARPTEVPSGLPVPADGYRIPR